LQVLLPRLTLGTAFCVAQNETGEINMQATLYRSASISLTSPLDSSVGR